MRCLHLYALKIEIAYILEEYIVYFNICTNHERSCVQKLVTINN